MNKLTKYLIICALLFVEVNSHAQTVPVWKLADLKAAVYESKEPTIINFWATFCKT